MSLDPAPARPHRCPAGRQSRGAVREGSPDAPQCGFSAKAVAALAATGADYARGRAGRPGDPRGIKAYGDWPTIPQLYIGGELVSGSDIIVQMAGSGESCMPRSAGPRRTAPRPRSPSPRPPPTCCARRSPMWATTRAAGRGGCRASIPGCNWRRATRMRSPASSRASARSSTSPARRARGLSIDWVEDAGRGPGDRERERADQGPRPHPGPGRRARAGWHPAAGGRAPARRTPDGRGTGAVSPPRPGRGRPRGLPKDTAIAFPVPQRGRSAQAAEHFRALGFTQLYNVAGGINAWALLDPNLRPY